MQLTLALLPAILGLAFAAPAPDAKAGVEARQITSVSLTFTGADNDASYSIIAPADGTPFTIDHPEISVSSIYLAGGATCLINGAEGGFTTVRINNNPVGSPQPQVGGACFRL